MQPARRAHVRPEPKQRQPYSPPGRGLQQVRHLDSRARRLRAFVSGLGSGALNRLLDTFDGDDAEGDGNAGLKRGLPDSAGALPGDIVEVGRGAAYEAAQTDHGVVAARPRQALRHNRYLERPRHARHIHGFHVRIMTPERVERAVQQAFGNKVVPPGHDDAEAQAGGDKISFEKVRHECSSSPRKVRLNRGWFLPRFDPSLKERAV